MICHHVYGSCSFPTCMCHCQQNHHETASLLCKMGSYCTCISCMQIVLDSSHIGIVQQLSLVDVQLFLQVYQF